MRIAITGSQGMLGRDLCCCLGLHHQVVPLRRSDADITNPSRVAEVIARINPDVIVHAAAFTAVDDCELQPELAYQVNAEGTRNVALAAQQGGMGLVYLSTDYVFDGEKPGAYVEEDLPRPLNVYGKSKLEGENYVRHLLAKFWIIRVSWLFGPLGKNFVRSILERARQGHALRVVRDQIGAPTYTADLAVKLQQVMERGEPGTYHVTNQGYCSWFDFAREILRQAGEAGVSISPIPSSELHRLAPRPKNSRLANSRLQSAGLGLLPGWEDALGRYLVREDRTKTLARDNLTW